MTREELLDRVLGECVPIHTDTWGTCQRHNVGWAPKAFETGRCWAVEKQVQTVEAALIIIHAQVQTLLDDMHADWSNPRYQAVLDVIDGKSDE